MGVLWLNVLAVLIVSEVLSTYVDKFPLSRQTINEVTLDSDESLASWEYANGYSWTMICWKQRRFEQGSELPTVPQGGKTSDCPPGLAISWSKPPPKETSSHQVFKSDVKLLIDHNIFHPANFFGYYVPHVAMYACLDVENVFCLPEVDDSSTFNKILQLAPPGRNATNATEYLFQSKLKLATGRYKVICNVNMYDNTTGDRIIMALGARTTANDDALSTFIVLGISAACILFLSVLIVLVFMFYRFNMERKKVKKLRPQRYPSNMLPPILDVEALSDFTHQHIPSKAFMALVKVGDGAYGEVFKGAMFRKGAPVLCAIKSLKEEHRHTLSEKFLREAEVMAQLKHSNIVRVIGISGADENEKAELCIIMEYLPGGDLKQYLVDYPHISTAERLWFTSQIASGCQYIASKGLVHRDIAARNCLIGVVGSLGFYNVKISDFGLARIFEGSIAQYVMESRDLMPIRWMAVESIVDRKFSEASDVWAYAVTVWEIFSNGNIPYVDTTSYSLAASIASGLRLGKPEKCCTAIFQLLQRCWGSDVKARPRFDEIASAMEVMFDNAQAKRDFTQDISSEQHTIQADNDEEYTRMKFMAINKHQFKISEIVPVRPEVRSADIEPDFQRIPNDRVEYRRLQYVNYPSYITSSSDYTRLNGIGLFRGTSV
eukprot:CFRG1819T1